MKINNNSISAENKSAEAAKPASGSSENAAPQAVTETAATSGEPQTTQEPAEQNTPAMQNTPAEQEAPAEKQPDMAARLAEAEMKGYLRGRNERIEELMREPTMYERQTAPAAKPDGELPEESSGSSHSEPMILNNRRVSIWDL